MSEPKIRPAIYYCPECDRAVAPQEVWFDSGGTSRHERHIVVKLPDETAEVQKS